MSVLYESSGFLPRLPPARAAVVLGVLFLGFTLLVGRAWQLQVYQKAFFKKKGEARYTRTIQLVAKRGVITDRHGMTLALSAQAASLWASPAEMGVLQNNQLRKLAEVLGLREAELKLKLSDRSREFVYLKRKMNPEITARAMALNIAGIYQQAEYKRLYPAHVTMAHIVGFAGMDEQGQEGIERAKNQLLSGTPGRRNVIRDRRGSIVEDAATKVAPKDGETIKLSVDSNVQYVAFRELRAGVAAVGAKAGGVVVLDARTGEVLALVNLPTYNPNNLAGVAPARMRNRVLIDQFEPGSMMKPITVSAALDGGFVRPNSVFQTAPGYLSIGPDTITDVHPHGALTLLGVIQKSSNVAIAKIALSMPAERLWSFFYKTGFGQAPQTGFPGEAQGRLRPHKRWRPVEQATMGYGYGISASLIQIARAYTMFANGGVVLPVSMMKLQRAPEGVEVVKPSTARAVLQMLEAVTQPGGTAPLAQVSGYRVGGKTGTAYKVAVGRYSKDKYVASFVGIAPISDPRLIIAVMIDEPVKTKHFGSRAAAPIFSRIATEVLRMQGVRPDATRTVAHPSEFDEPDAEALP